MSPWYEGELVKITSDTTEIPLRYILIECGESSYGMGNHWVIDWKRFYEILESQYGFDMQDLGGYVDNKIRRIVREAVREGNIS